MKFPTIRRALLLATGVVTTALLAQSSGVTVLTNRATELRASADDGSRLIRTLSPQTSLEKLERASGLWTRVKVGADIGYVRMMHIGGGATVTQTESSFGSGVASGVGKALGIGSSGPKKNEVATVGIRGLTKDAVEKANPDTAQFSRAKTFQASASDAQRLANEGRLAFRSIAYLAKDAVEASKGKS